jgi:hypothetical protein
MYLTKKFMIMNKVSIAIFIFLFFIGIVHYTKPTIIYLEDGSFRHFGLGYRNKTVTPIWIVAIVLAIVAYMIVLYSIMYY